jgi:hypothetical protein
VFKKAHHWTLSCVSWIQFVPPIPISLRSSLMLSSHLRLGLPSDLLPSGPPEYEPEGQPLRGRHSMKQTFTESSHIIKTNNDTINGGQQ